MKKNYNGWTQFPLLTSNYFLNHFQWFQFSVLFYICWEMIIVCKSLPLLITLCCVEMKYLQNALPFTAQGCFALNNTIKSIPAMAEYHSRILIAEFIPGCLIPWPCATTTLSAPCPCLCLADSKLNYSDQTVNIFHCFNSGMGGSSLMDKPSYK